jgi:hypothetical protein
MTLIKGRIGLQYSIFGILRIDRDLSTDKRNPAAAIFAQAGERPAAASPSPLADQKPLRQQIHHPGVKHLPPLFLPFSWFIFQVISVMAEYSPAGGAMPLCRHQPYSG